MIPALIRKFQEGLDGGADHVEVWGTGQASREFLYVSDAARGIALATEQYSGADPVNLGAGFEITIRELARTIARQMGFAGEVRFNPAYPDGQPRRCLDTSRAERLFGFRATTSFEDGLRQTIDWYRAHGPR